MTNTDFSIEEVLVNLVRTMQVYEQTPHESANLFHSLAFQQAIEKVNQTEHDKDIEKLREENKKLKEAIRKCDHFFEYIEGQMAMSLWRTILYEQAAVATHEALGRKPYYEREEVKQRIPS